MDQAVEDGVGIGRIADRGTSFNSDLTAIVAGRGKPGMIVSDHGTEFTCNAMLAWSKDTAIDWHFIAPGKPMQNGFIESFNGPDA
jgi:transposase InsO family protein